VCPFEQKVSFSAEIVEEVQMAKSDSFCTGKNQQLTGRRKSKNAQIWGFGQPRYLPAVFRLLKKLRYVFHILNRDASWLTVILNLLSNPLLIIR
jgi:hypothetical protein